MSSAASLFYPPAPKPRATPAGFFATIRTLRNNPIELWSERHYENPIIVGRTFFGDRAVVSDPAAIRRIFLDNVANYRKDDLQLRILKPGLGEGLLTADGENWRAQRRSLAPLFTPRQVEAFAPAMAAVAREGVERLQRRREGRPVDMSLEMARVTLEVLEHTLFSEGLGRKASEFQSAVSAYFETIGRIDPLDLLDMPSFLPRLGRRRARATLEWFTRAVDDLITQRRALIAKGVEPPKDILTLLLKAQDPETGLAMSEDDLRSNIVTFIGAGHETTANALTWTLYLLSQSPEWRVRVEAEADQQLDAGPIETLAARMPETKAVLEEAMRLYPPVAILSRQAINADRLGTMAICAGAVVIVAPFVLHRHRLLWKDPDAFDPTRFLGANRDTIDRFAYIPFGAGPRVCIGMGFAVQEAMILLAHLARAFRFSLTPGHIVRPQQRITLRPGGGMPMIVETR